MSDVSSFSRSLKARFIRTLLVYLGAAWAILEVIGFLIDNLGFPEWLLTAMLALLAVGLATLIATAWAQALPAVDVPDDEDAVVRGFRLTWRQWTLGGLMAVSLLIGFSGLFALLSKHEPEFPIILDSAAGPAIAVLPFRVAGATRELWEEGMVDLLYYNLDGAGGYRVIHPQLLRSRWEAEGGDRRIATSAKRRLSFARSLGASHALWGNVAESGSSLRLTAELHDVQGDAVIRAHAEGPTDSLTVVIDRLCADLMSSVLLGGSQTSEFRHAYLATTSYPALVAFLEGERLFRRSRFTEAVAAYIRAAETDPEFAMAYRRVVQAHSWGVGYHSPTIVEYEEKLIELFDRLPARTQLLLRSGEARRAGDPSAFAMLDRFVASYPDDADGWYELGEVLFHEIAWYHMIPEARRRARAAFQRAIQLDPGFGPAYLHLVDDAMEREEYDALQQLVDSHGRIDPESPTAQGLALFWALTRGDSGTRARGYESMDTMSSAALSMAYHRLYRSAHLYPEPLWAIARENRKSRHPENLRVRSENAAIKALSVWGRIAEARDSLDSWSESGRRRAWRLNMHELNWYLAAYPYLRLSHDVFDYLSRSPSPWPSAPIAAGISAVAVGEWEQVEAQLRVLESYSDAPSGNWTSDWAERASEAIRAYAELRKGDLESARARIERVLPGWGRPWIHAWLRLELGRVLIELGDLDEAEHHLRGLQAYDSHVIPTYGATPVEFYLGEIYRLRGDYEKARLHYGRFVSLWDKADRELKPWWEVARRTLKSLAAE